MVGDRSLERVYPIAHPGGPGSACVGTMRAAFEYALDFTRTEKRLGTVPLI